MSTCSRLNFFRESRANWSEIAFAKGFIGGGFAGKGSGRVFLRVFRTSWWWRIALDRSGVKTPVCWGGVGYGTKFTSLVASGHACLVVVAVLPERAPCASSVGCFGRRGGGGGLREVDLEWKREVGRKCQRALGGGGDHKLARSVRIEITSFPEGLWSVGWT